MKRKNKTQKTDLRTRALSVREMETCRGGQSVWVYCTQEDQDANQQNWCKDNYYG